MRTQSANYQACLERIAEMINEAARLPGETSDEQRKKVDQLYVPIQ